MLATRSRRRPTGAGDEDHPDCNPATRLPEAAFKECKEAWRSVERRGGKRRLAISTGMPRSSTVWAATPAQASTTSATSSATFGNIFGGGGGARSRVAAPTSAYVMEQPDLEEAVAGIEKRIDPDPGREGLGLGRRQGRHLRHLPRVGQVRMQRGPFAMQAGSVRHRWRQRQDSSPTRASKCDGAGRGGEEDKTRR